MTASIETLYLALIVIAIICTLYISFMSLKTKWWWALYFFVMPGVFYFGSKFAGSLIAGVVVIGAQIPIVILANKHWSSITRIFTYAALCLVGVIVIDVRRYGWIPEDWRRKPEVVQAAAPVVEEDTYFASAGARVWYRKTGTGAGTPVILIHGGPGAASFYLKPLQALGDDRPVVRYDQMGSGHSDKVADTTLFTVEHFVAELDSLRSTLGFEKAHLVGHSWGAIVALEYYRSHPERVASLTLASPALNVPEWSRNARKLVATLSDSAQAAIKAREPVNDFDAPDYQSAVAEYNDRYVSKHPDETERDSTMKLMNNDIYMFMWGPSEFTVTGTLRTYDATRQLRRIKVPTLYTVGEFDEADPVLVRRFATLTPGARYEVIPGAAHVTTWDNADAMLAVVRDFLRNVDTPPAANP